MTDNISRYIYFTIKYFHNTIVDSKIDETGWYCSYAKLAAVWVPGCWNSLIPVHTKSTDGNEPIGLVVTDRFLLF